MFSSFEKAQFLEISKAASRWYVNNQNTNDHPWGGMKNSADLGRFMYEYFPAEKTGRGGVVWSQALAVMALHSLMLQQKKNVAELQSACELAGRYMFTLQNKDTGAVQNFGGFNEQIPDEGVSYPRDAATGGMGLCALYRMTGHPQYLQSAERFAQWYGNYGCDKDGWPYISYDFVKGEGTNRLVSDDVQKKEWIEAIKGDWQAGGALFFYYLSCVSGKRKYIEDHLLPMMPKLLDIYGRNPVDKITFGFHCDVEVSSGNDDFALVTLLAAYRCTKKKKYLDVARERINGFLQMLDEESGRFPSFGGTFVSGITMHVLNQLDLDEGRKPDPKLVKAVERVARKGVELQVFDYHDPRAHGGFWCQSQYGAGKHTVHHRSTGYATIFYLMMEGSAPIPYYHCLHWEIPKK